MLRLQLLIGIGLASLVLFTLSTTAQTEIVDICSGAGIQSRAADFSPGGIIMTAFDAEDTWVYDIERATRYPLPETSPCFSNCNLSPDAAWMSYINPDTFIFNKMRLDGTERTPLASDAAEISWWDEGTLLVWTPDHRAYLRAEADPLAPAEFLDTDGVQAIQPGGYWAVVTEYDEGNFLRYMVNLQTRDTSDEQRILLAPDRPYYNAMSWSPDGQMLAYVGRGAFDSAVNTIGAELYLTQPGSAIPQQATFLFNQYGAVRINGFTPGELSWSPDNLYIAFWVIEMLGTNPEGSTGNAVLHVLHVGTGRLQRYCGFTTTEHTPNPPRLVWSPDGSHIAFAGNVPGDNKGVLLLVMDIVTGELTEMTDGIYPVLGQADVVAWGNKP